MASVQSKPVGQHLLPSLVDEIALTDPERILYSIAKTKDAADGFIDVSATAFARAVNRCAWHLHKNLGPGQGFPTIAYMGPQDLVYGILILASIKAGYKLLLNSPRNTLDAHLSLFEETHCSTFLLPPNFPLPVIKQILAARHMRVLEVPELQYWLEDGVVEPYPYSKTFQEAKSDPFAVLHTSGSVGLPKPIVQTHGTHVPLDAYTALPSLGHQPVFPAMCTGTRVYVTFPLFHCAGVVLILPGVIYSGYTVVLGTFPPSAETVNSIHVHGNVQHTAAAPTTLVELAKVPEYLDNLSRLTQIAYGGGPCPQAVGDLISTKTRLLNCLGTTECGVHPYQLCDPEDWKYMKVCPVLGHEYRHVSEDLYEQVVVRNPDLQQYQGIFGTFPHLDEWPMKDLYSRHPTKPDVWLYRGRTDDIIVYSTGEKLNPVEMEHIIGADPSINGALIIGTGRFQSSLLVEAVQPPTDNVEKEKLLELIWPSIEAANKVSPSHGRIHRNMVDFTSTGKPMMRAGKGTIQRALTLDLYAAEIDALYDENELSASGPADDAIQSYGSVQRIVKHVVATSTDIDITELLSDTDLFEHGLDSLQVTLITKRLNRSIQAYGGSSTLQAKDIYSNPTLATLTAIVADAIEGKAQGRGAEFNQQKMRALYNLHSANNPITARKAEVSTEGLVVLLTGSTGSLGSYILDRLLSDPRVSLIHCLNRGPRSAERQEKSQTTKGLQPLSDKVKFHDVDPAASYFGLSIQEYKKLLFEVTHVIHNAWKVDFNQSLDSFASQVGTVKRLIDFSAHSRYGACLFFVSSIGAVANWGAVHEASQAVPEEVHEDWRIPEATGYGESKFVAERLLDAAAREADITATICRVGQVAGPTTTAGEWPRQEWLPSLVASSKYIGKLPSSLGRMEAVDWVPVDVLGKIIVELSTHSLADHAGPTVYHVANPQKTPWGQLVPTVKRCLGGVEVVPLEEWVDALCESASKTESPGQNPAIKIVDFFKSLVTMKENPIALETIKTARVSQTLLQLQGVDVGWMENWMRQWAF